MMQKETVNDSRRRLTKNEKRRQKKRDNYRNDKVVLEDTERKLDAKSEDAIEIEYIGADFEQNLSGIDERIMSELLGIVAKFKKPEELTKSIAKEKLSSVVDDRDLKLISDESPTSNEVSHELVTATNPKLSKKKKKLISRLSIAELKQLVARPDVVEAHDVSSSDPRLLVYLKGYRNTVPVPRHWCQIRKYLQGKRGSEKVPYQLPEFIADTGIAKIREAIMEQEELKKSKQKARERVRPKMGRIDIDYQVLHDAFFKYQTKPKMTIHGDLYYEGKEFEVQMKEKLPGILSNDLIQALGVQEGAPPPWLINMQRYGPPPSYPNLRIPGLNAPLPHGASYGFQPGGWGKPPVDEFGRPLYGDVFGNAVTAEVDTNLDIDTNFRWGTFEFDDVENQDDDEYADEDEDDATGLETNRLDKTGLETPSSIDGNSLLSGLETPETIDLRKREGYETPDVLASRELFHIIQERKVASGSQIFGSDRQYVIPSKGDVQLSINPEDLEDMMNNKERLKGAHESHVFNNQSELLLGQKIDASHANELDERDQSKKRKAETPLVYKKAKEFKF